jgi:hypothetical protein
MITFSPTEEQQMLVESIHRYAENQLRKAAHDADEASEVGPTWLRKGGSWGCCPA